MKQLFTLAVMILIYGFGLAQQSFTTVTYTNNSGQDLVIAFAQGALPGQQAYQVNWLQYNPTQQTYNWTVPVPKKASDLSGYIFTVKNGGTLSVKVPAYTLAVGFRCLVADPVYRQKAFVQKNKKTKTPAYMGFPNLETDNYLYDKFEAGLTIGSPGVWNITAVDFVAIPMQISSGNQTVGFKDGVTASGLFNVLNQLPYPYNQGDSITPNAVSNTVRFFSPAHIPTATSVLDSLIYAECQQIDSTVTVKYGNYVFSQFQGMATIDTNGLVVGTISAQYTCSSCEINTPRTISVNDVTTVNALAGTIVGEDAANHSDTLAQIQLGAILSAAICRGILNAPSSWGDIVHNKSNCPYPWNYYPAGVEVDEYSKLIHQYSIDSKNYGFPYDDYFGDEAGFTVLPGDIVNIHIMPLTGTMTAAPNGPISEQTGCLMVTVPAESIYPVSSTWPLGTMYVENERVTAGSGIFCSLPGDTVTCTFSSKPDVMLYVFQNPAESSPGYSFVDNSGAAFPVTGITNMTYMSDQYNMTFADTVSWEYGNSWSISLPSAYPATWGIDTIFVNGAPLVAGANADLIQPDPSLGDTVICTFSSQPGLQLCLIANENPIFRSPDTISYPVNGITNMNCNSSQQTLVFGSAVSFENEGAWTINMPSSQYYPSDTTNWKIGTIYVNGNALVANGNTNLVPSSPGDTLVCTFSSNPNLEMCLINGQPIVFRNIDHTPCTITGITGLNAPTGNTITFGSAASWED